MRKKFLSLLLTTAMVTTLVGCGGKDEGKDAAKVDDNKQPATQEAAKPTEGSSEATPEAKVEEKKEIKHFTGFFAVPGTEINDNNVAQQKLTELLGADCKETWLTGQSAEEAIGTIMAGGDYPDFIDGSTGTPQLIAEGALVALDEHWDNYPNIKNYLSESDWNKVRAEDGHVYIMPQFGIIHGKDVNCTHNDEAFWIQTRVLKWAGYPKITTMDQFFDVIDRYMEANPTMPDGTPNIGYEICTDDWRYFGLENPPFFLDGYPNDGCCIVNDTTHEVSDYNMTPTAKRYYAKLNEQYKKGIVDPESFTNKHDQYIAKITSGRVCGMIDQHWNFNDGEEAIKTQKLDGCTYVPVGCVIDEGIKERYHSASALDVSNGLGITTKCEDLEGALAFVNGLLSPEAQTLRYWGIEGVDYNKGADGVFTRTQEMRDNYVSKDYQVANLCKYAYFPHYEGMNLDDINAWDPVNQPSEFFEGLTPDIQECLTAYGAKTYVDLLNPSTVNNPWFPMWSYSNNFTADTPQGLAKQNMDDVKHEYLPKVVMADDFESAWADYVKVYADRCDIASYLGAIREEVDRRIAVAEGK